MVNLGEEVICMEHNKWYDKKEIIAPNDWKTVTKTLLLNVSNERNVNIERVTLEGI